MIDDIGVLMYVIVAGICILLLGILLFVLYVVPHPSPFITFGFLGVVCLVVVMRTASAVYTHSEKNILKNRAMVYVNDAFSGGTDDDGNDNEHHHNAPKYEEV